MDSSAFFSSALGQGYRVSGQQETRGKAWLFYAAALGILFFFFAAHHGSAASGSPMMAGVAGVLACPSTRRKRTNTKIKGCRRLPGRDHPIIEQLANLILIGRDLVGAKSAAGTLLDVETGRHFEWEAPDATSDLWTISSELEQYTSGVASEWSLAAYSRAGSAVRRLVLDAEGHELHDASFSVKYPPFWTGATHSVLLANFAFDERWKSRLIFFDAPLPQGEATALRRLQRVIRLAAPAYESQLRSPNRGLKEEREEIARDLHDGIAQSLVVAEMNVCSLIRRGASVGITPDVEGILTDAQCLLRQEARRVRQQIEDLRSHFNGQIGQRLSKMIQIFQAETGIQTSLRCERACSAISGESAHTILQIVQEALSNVRKHSGATTVQIHLAMERQFHLIVQDNGRGLAFSGRYSLPELEVSGTGPRVIRERVRASDGYLEIESHRNLGVRLEVVLPLQKTRDNGAMSGAGEYSLPPKIGVRNVTAGKQLDVA